jgi:DNA polymerase-1
MGNFRRRLADGPLTPREERWAMNHTVQATASLIFKTALIEIGKRFGFASILLPMHDAVLLQFHPGKIARTDFEGECAALMKNAFQTVCPGIRAKVSIGSFVSAE